MTAETLQVKGLITGTARLANLTLKCLRETGKPSMKNAGNGISY
jgi:hypothetical protein